MSQRKKRVLKAISKYFQTTLWNFDRNVNPKKPAYFLLEKCLNDILKVRRYLKNILFLSNFQHFFYFKIPLFAQKTFSVKFKITFYEIVEMTLLLTHLWPMYYIKNNMHLKLIFTIVSFMYYITVKHLFITLV